MKERKKIIILGAGPVGLISGWLLSKKNWEVKIFEKNSIIGGMCRSWRWGKFRVDTGPHIFHTPDKKLWRFWKKNFGKFLVEGKFQEKNTYNEDFKKLYDYIVFNIQFPLTIDNGVGYGPNNEDYNKELENDFRNFNLWFKIVKSEKMEGIK